ncbi:MAG: hypothetical protein KJO75_16165, partial [Dactylosporangium sp.]|nr:hypothetical protein [Dactylosporangium sp.]
LGEGGYVLAHPLLVPPNVNVRGSGITATTVLLAPAAWSNFGYSFLVKPDGTVSAGSTNLVSDLTVNGNCKIGAGAPDPQIAPVNACDLGAARNYGGGIKAGDRWTVRQVRFTNLNYFKLWIAGTSDAHAIDNRFDGWGGAGSGDEDNIGGGANAIGTVLDHNQFDATIRGNSVDFTNASEVTITHNTVHATREYLAFRGVSDYGSIYLEGVTSSTVAANVLSGAHLVLQSNSRYDHSGNNVNVTNAKAIAVTDNQIIDSFHTGITVVYDDYAGDPHVALKGGANVFTGNAITRPTLSGILIVGCVADPAAPVEMQDQPDTLTGNTITNAGYGGSTSFSTGCGTFDTTGIGTSIGDGDLVYDNTIVDDQAAPTTWYGIHIGARNGQTAPRNMVLTDPTDQSTNTASGVIGGLLRTAAAAPAPPTELTGVRNGADVTVAWKEAYQSAGFMIGGYRVYRDGAPIATFPVSPTVAGNLLTEAQSSLESGIAGTDWARVTLRTQLGWYGMAGAVGDASLALTAVGSSGQVSALGATVDVTAGASYTSTASFQALGTGSKIRAGIAWLDANNASLGKVLPPASGLYTDSTGAWLTRAFTATAPAGAVRARPFVVADTCLAGETHLVDRIALVAGPATESWTEVNAPAGPGVYQVVAFRSTDGENSPAASVPVP